MTIPQRIQFLKGKLDELRRKDPKMEVFGAGDNPWYDILGHHYQMRDVLTERQIKESEELLKIKLPEEYREFLKLFGDGGAGPGWGLYELTNTYPDKEFTNEYPDFFTMEFPYDNAYATGILGDLKNDITLRGPFDEYFGGYIKLCNYGHDMFGILIVSGEQYGKIWMLDEEKSITPFYQNIKGRSPGVGFLDWFENWMDEYLVPGAAKSQF